jgi:hypothetical protein
MDPESGSVMLSYRYESGSGDLYCTTYYGFGIRFGSESYLFVQWQQDDNKINLRYIYISLKKYR